MSKTESTVTHGTFSLERTYPVPARRVFAAFSDKNTKRRWFVEGEGWDVEQYEADFRVEGRETSRFRFQGGPEITNDTIYQDIIPERRIVFAYRMAVGGKPISVSLTTIELEPTKGGTLLRYTEQGAFFDDPKALQMREEGCGGLLDALANELARAA